MTLSLTRTALFLLAGTALTACTTVEPVRPNFPTRPAPSQPLPVPPPPVRQDEPAMQPRPIPPVESSQLPSISPPRPQPVRPAPRPMTTETVTRTTVAGKVVETAGPAKDYTVKPGDNLDAIARTMGTTRKQIADDNDLKPPYALRPGQVLKGPRTTSAKAYVVGQGDTLFAIAQRFSVSATAIAQANDREIEAPLAIGERLILPEGFKDKGPTTIRTQVTAPARDVPPTPSTPTYSEPVRQPSRPTPPPIIDEPATTIRTRVTGKVVDAAGAPKTYKVKSGDNLDGIARSLDTTRKDLAEDNKLKPPYALQPGQVLKGPETKVKAYVVGQGDTQALIAKRFGVTQRALADANNVKIGAPVRAGRQVILPAGYRDRGPIREEVAAPRPKPAPVPTYTPPVQTYPAPVQPTPAPTPYDRPPVTPPPIVQPPATRPAPVRPTPVAPPVTRPSTPPTPAAPVVGTPTDAQITSFGRGRFIWPLRGDVISDFGPKGTGQRNDGLNIRVSTGEPVRAAAAGDVVYAGDQVPGFGNLVLVKHADGWVTAYGHMSRVDVKMQQKITQGQQIGQAGSTGGVTEPQLHFEVRYAPTPQDRARPIDPKLVLPK